MLITRKKTIEVIFTLSGTLTDSRKFMIVTVLAYKSILYLLLQP